MNGDTRSNPFDGPQMQRAHYERADMTGSNFDGVNLCDTRFFAVLSKARFVDTKMDEVEFDDVNLSQARFHNVNLSGTTIKFANLSKLNIRGVTLADTTIDEADLTGMRINGILVTDLLAAYEAAKG